MNVWFVRSNATPVHNDPVNYLEEYVPGEPHVRKKENYVEMCLDGGFARIGWPNTGPLQPGFDSDRYPDSERQAVKGYTLESIEPTYQVYLREFASIFTGDLILTPMGNRADIVFYVHIGVVVRRDRATREIICIRPGLAAYYYYHDIPGGQPYECAHRVDVLWDRAHDRSFGVHYIEGMNWRRAFCCMNQSNGAAIEVARRVGLPIAV